MFTKNDLQTGDFVVRRNGSVDMLLKEKNVFICEDGGWNDFDCINTDLTNKSTTNNYDIIKIYRPVAKHHNCFNSYTKGEVVFDRGKEVVMTIEEIEKRLGITNLKIIKN